MFSSAVREVPAAKKVSTIVELLENLRQVSDHSAKKAIFYANEELIKNSATISESEAQELFWHLRSADKHKKLMEIIPWSKIELSALSKKILLAEQHKISAVDCTALLASFSGNLEIQKDILKKFLSHGDKSPVATFMGSLGEQKLKIEDWKSLMTSFAGSPDVQREILKGFLSKAKDFNPEEIVQIGQTYISEESSRISTFITLLKEAKTDKTTLVVDGLLKPYLDKIKQTNTDTEKAAAIEKTKEILSSFLANTNNIKEIGEIGKAYVTPDNWERIQVFVNLLIEQQKIKTLDQLREFLQPSTPFSSFEMSNIVNHFIHRKEFESELQSINDLQNFLKPFSEDEQESIISGIVHNKKFVTELSSIKEIGLTLGLKGAVYLEGYAMEPSNKMAKQRFRDLAPGDEELEFHLTNSYDDAAKLYEPLKKAGDLRGIHADWERHAFSFHLIQDKVRDKDSGQLKDVTHLIYVNRGQRSKQNESARAGDASVMVFTFDDRKKVEEMMPQLLTALKTKKRDDISTFLHGSLMPYHNSRLSAELKKSDQKVGNCSVANANMAWHLALAAREMKKENCSFSEAYANTRVEYKDMRMRDRARSFCKLMTDPVVKEFREEAVPKVLSKMVAKDRRTPGREMVRFLLDSLHTHDPNAVKGLLNDLCHSKYDLGNSDRLKWIEACVKKLKEEKLYLPEDQKMVEDSMVMIKFSILKKQLAGTSFMGGLSNTSTNPLDINLISQKYLPHLVIDHADLCSYLSIENVKSIFKQAPHMQKALINLLSPNQIKILFQNKDINFNDLSTKQKENIDIIKAILSVAPNCICLVSNKVLKEMLQSSPIDFNALSEAQKGNIELFKEAYREKKECVQFFPDVVLKALLKSGAVNFGDLSPMQKMNTALFTEAYKEQNTCIHFFSNEVVIHLLKTGANFDDLSVKQKEDNNLIKDLLENRVIRFDQLSPEQKEDIHLVKAACMADKRCIHSVSDRIVKSLLATNFIDSKDLSAKQKDTFFPPVVPQVRASKPEASKAEASKTPILDFLKSAIKCFCDSVSRMLNLTKKEENTNRGPTVR